MSRSFSQTILVGTIGKDVETRKTASDLSVSNFTVATNKRWKDQTSGEFKEEVEWHTIVLWRNDGVLPFLLKGRQVCIVGHNKTRSYEKDGVKKWSTEVIVDEIMLLGAKGGGSSDADETPSAPAGASDGDVPW